MAASGSKTLPSIGFFTVTEDAESGFIGGLLVLNAAGRPLEFHCTAPLKPNRAQQILYGSTLRPFLYGEQIGATLASKARNDTLFLCTDTELAMCLRDSIETPLLLVTPQSTGSAEVTRQEAGICGSEESPGVQAIFSSATSRLTPFTLGRNLVAVDQNHQSDREWIREQWQLYADHLDLCEPFGRIREALDEAQRGAAK